jgi:siroheme decarboxylase
MAHPNSAGAALTELEFKLLNCYQRGFPLQPRPFAAIAAELGVEQETVLQTLRRLQQDGVVSRVGPVFRPNAIGVSTLAALAVPPERLAQVAGYVNAHAEINHNYEREHRYNLWFVATAASAERLCTVLQEIEDICECGPVLRLPMVEDYHIDLGFNLSLDTLGRVVCAPPAAAAPCSSHFLGVTTCLSAGERDFVSVLQNGLPYVAQPYSCLGIPEAEAIATIARWLDTGVIKRFGVIVRHHELGFTANAMTVWNIPDTEIREAGRRIAASGRVTLCYRRPRHLPGWPYNLFCMVHGKGRLDVETRIAELSAACALGAYPHEVLFSRRRFKQRGAYYAPHSELAHG